jgi:arylsulfatase A
MHLIFWNRLIIISFCWSGAFGAQSVVTDIRPDDPAGYIDTESPYASVPLAILSTSVDGGDSVNFDSASVDGSSVRLGPALAMPDNNLGAVRRDVDNDGDQDVELFFHVPDTGIQCNQNSINVTGSTVNGEAFFSSTNIVTPVCPQCHDGEQNTRRVDSAGMEYFSVAEDSTLQMTDFAENGFVGLVSGVDKGSLNVANDGSFTYIPELNYFGLDEFSYENELGQTNTVKISVMSVNDAPIALPDEIGIAASAELVRAEPGIMANDVDVDGDPLTVELISDVTSGQLILDPNGSFSYVPGAGFNGFDRFSYRLNDGLENSNEVDVNISLPNVLIIMVDDMGQGDAQVYNPGSAINMPSLDALAAAGIHFTQAHSPAAACSPTRYSLMTGNYPYRGRQENGVWKSFDPDPMLLPGQITLGDMARQANYRTGYIGKTHDGHALSNEAGTGYTRLVVEADFSKALDKAPTQFGFDYSFILPGGIGSGPYAYFENDRLVRLDTVSGAYLPFEIAASAHEKMVSVSNGQSFNGGLIGSGGIAIDNYDSRQAGSVLTEQALAFIDNHQQQNEAAGSHRPFFLYMAPPQPHTPWSPPPVFNPAEPTDIEVGAPGSAVAGVTQISGRTDSVYETDLILGTLVTKLDEKGLLANTLIIFTSDNGANRTLSQSGYYGSGERVETGPEGLEHFNAQGIDAGVPLRGSKAEIYEGGHRVPLIMRWGDGTPEGSVIEPDSASLQMIGLQDMMLTIADLIGVSMPTDQANDSFSYRQLLLGEPDADEYVREHMFVQGRPLSGNYENMGRALYMRDAQGDLWKLIAEADMHAPEDNINFVSLHNLTADPGEENNMLTGWAAQEWVDTMTDSYLEQISQSRTAH